EFQIGPELTGSVLFALAGKGEEDGTPFIMLPVEKDRQATRCCAVIFFITVFILELMSLLTWWYGTRGFCMGIKLTLTHLLYS
ncbi:MAG: hypothetical protein R6U69_11750, partial [Marinobacter sp.]|uniref:hypothetical protein n=1 Tax=Marinobacter sp. TaxID=50741 RepID=UPI003975F131